MPPWMSREAVWILIMDVVQAMVYSTLGVAAGRNNNEMDLFFATGDEGIRMYHYRVTSMQLGASGLLPVK